MDIQFWKKSGNQAIQRKIQLLLQDIIVHPYTEIGKPELLKYELKNKWSRRINQEDRLVYEIKDGILHIHSLKTL